jgi:hypothetical protein
MSCASSRGQTSRLGPPISDILRRNLDHGRHTRRAAAATLPKPSITAYCLRKRLSWPIGGGGL